MLSSLAVETRIKTILCEADFKRLEIVENVECQEGCLEIIADVHGMTRNRARKFISNLIAIIHREFHLIIIHGFNHGTAIKDMLMTDFTNSHILERFTDLSNPGRTHMILV